MDRHTTTTRKANLTNQKTVRVYTDQKQGK